MMTQTSGRERERAGESQRDIRRDAVNYLGTEVTRGAQIWSKKIPQRIEVRSLAQISMRSGARLKLRELKSICLRMSSWFEHGKLGLHGLNMVICEFIRGPIRNLFLLVLK